MREWGVGGAGEGETKEKIILTVPKIAQIPAIVEQTPVQVYTHRPTDN